MSFDSSAAAPVAPTVNSLLEAGRFLAKTGSMHRPREIQVPVEGSRGTLRWIVTRERSFDCELIHAWMEFANPQLCKEPLVQVELPLVSCRIVRDGFGDPRLELGATSFTLPEHLAHSLHERFDIAEAFEE